MELRVAGAHRRGLGVGVGDARHGVVVGLPGLAEDVRRDDVALVLADVGQRPGAGHVADRPQALTRAHVLVHRDPVGVNLDADRLEADPLHTGSPPRRDQEAVAAELGPVVELQDGVVAVAARRDGLDAHVDLDALAAQGLGERLAEGGRVVGEQVVGALHHRHLATQAPHDLAQLQAGRPAAQHDEAPRDLLHARRLPGAPHAGELAQAGDRRDERVGAARDDDVVGRVACAVDLDDARSGEAARAAHDGDPPVGQPALGAGVVPVGDHVVAPGERRGDVHLRRGLDVARALHRLAGAQERLGGDARPVGALAADELPLDDGDAQAALGERGGAVLAGGAAAQHDHVIVGAHVGSSVPACSATMYREYQSGQFSSACPVRFSCSPWAAAARRSAPCRSSADA